MVVYREESNSLGLFPKYLRRPDLDGLTRLSIGLLANSDAPYGTIVQLAESYKISRQFVYYLRDQVTAFCSLFSSYYAKKGLLTERRESLAFILEQRLIGKSSIGAISELMKRRGLSYSSTGFISSVLGAIGQSLPDTLDCRSGLTVAVVFASDEVFAHNRPILVTVDPVSSAILRIELAQKRDAETWQKHWQTLEANDICSLYVVSDEGTGLMAARKAVFPDQKHQTDSYHSVAHVLGAWRNRLEAAAYKAIEAEYEAERIIQSAKSEKVILKRMEKYFSSQKKVRTALSATMTFVSYIK